jgi:hypothetical protein
MTVGYAFHQRLRFGRAAAGPVFLADALITPLLEVLVPTGADGIELTPAGFDVTALVEILVLTDVDALWLTLSDALAEVDVAVLLTTPALALVLPVLLTEVEVAPAITLALALVLVTGTEAVADVEAAPFARFALLLVETLADALFDALALVAVEPVLPVLAGCTVSARATAGSATAPPTIGTAYAATTATR